MKKILFSKAPPHLEQALCQLKRDLFLQHASLEWASLHKWDSSFQNGIFSSQELADMMFYVENPQVFGYQPTDLGTGNLFFSSQDTYKDLETRLSHHAKVLVREVVLPHFKKWKFLINQSKKMEKIQNRFCLEQAYLPHFYHQSKRLAPLQPSERLFPYAPCSFSKKRRFLTYHEAWIRAAHLPRFQSLKDLLHEYDRRMIKDLMKSELIEKIFAIETHLHSPLILEADSALYQHALHQGWVSCNQADLSQYFSKSSIWDTLGAPLLLHPKLIEVFQDLAPKKKKKKSLFWNIYDKISDFLKTIHVSLSGFHYLTLLEESAKSSGWNFFKSYQRGGQLLKDPVFMEEFIYHGGIIGHNPELIHPLKKPQKHKKWLLHYLAKLEYFAHLPSRFLFETFQPRLKVTAFHDMRQYYLHVLQKKGLALDTTKMKQINQELTALANDMFGGQCFEAFVNPTSLKALDLHNPVVLKRWRRVGGYVDWTISAIREFIKTIQGLLELMPNVPKTPTGTLARRHFFRYVLNLFVISQLLNYFFTGFSQDTHHLTWHLQNSHSTFSNHDVSRKGVLDIQLPDLSISIMGKSIALGRDLQGRKLYTHFGKKLLENFHYFQDPVRALYNKSNPVLQTLFVQLAGGAPTLEGIPFKEQQTYCRGSAQPWGGKQGWHTTLPRCKHLLKITLPYSLQSFEDRGMGAGLAQFFITGFGSLPIRKGLNLKSAEKFYANYLDHDPKHVAEIDQMLTDNGYSPSQIQNTKTRARKKYGVKNQGVDYDLEIDTSLISIQEAISKIQLLLKIDS